MATLGRREPALERPDLPLQLFILRRQRLLARREVMVVLPPVEPDLLRFIDRTDEKPDPDRQKFDFSERHLDVARHDEALIEHTVENINEPGRSSVPFRQCRRHRLAILRGTVPRDSRHVCTERYGQAYLSNEDATVFTHDCPRNDVKLH